MNLISNNNEYNNIISVLQRMRANESSNNKEIENEIISIISKNHRIANKLEEIIAILKE